MAYMKPLVGANINFSDPRYQRAVAESYAGKGQKAIWNTGEATSDFTAQQEDLRYQVAESGLRSEINLAREDQTNWKLKQENKEANKKEKAIPITVGMGLFNTVATTLQQQAADERAQAERVLEQQRHEENISWMRKIYEQSMVGRI